MKNHTHQFFKVGEKSLTVDECARKHTKQNLSHEELCPVCGNFVGYRVIYATVVQCADCLEARVLDGGGEL